jgi:SAM-dependent methyltransferase
MDNPMPRPFYGEYAWAYDLLNERPIWRECGFIAALMGERGISSGATILDAGCGTGRYAVELACRGYVVSGLDLSPQLIAAARQRLRQSALPVSFAVGDILVLSCTSPYDGILCRGVLNDLREEQSRQEVFRAFARALRPGGVLILDVREWHATVRRKSRQPVFEKSVDTAHGQLTFRSMTRLDHAHRQLLVAEQHTLRKNGEDLTAAYDFVMRCWTQEELHHHLTQAGFQSVTYFGDYNGTVPPGATDRLVSVASRCPG